MDHRRCGRRRGRQSQWDRRESKIVHNGAVRAAILKEQQHAFAFAVAGLLDGRIDKIWAQALKPYITAAWCALTAGIALGSWWAYYELGWGGW